MGFKPFARTISVRKSFGRPVAAPGLTAVVVPLKWSTMDDCLPRFDVGLALGKNRNGSHNDGPHCGEAIDGLIVLDNKTHPP